MNHSTIEDDPNSFWILSHSVVITLTTEKGSSNGWNYRDLTEDLLHARWQKSMRKICDS